MSVPPEARPFHHAMERAQRDGLRGPDAFVRALELLTIERGSHAAKRLLASLRDVLAGNLGGFVVPDIDLALARELVDRLDPVPQAARLRKIQTSSRSLRGPAFGEALLERARAALPGDPRASGGWAECAVRAMQYSEAEEPRERAHIASCLARAWAFWGNSLRILCDLRGAQRLVQQADRTIEFNGIGDLATRAEIASFRGSLLRAQREFAESIKALEVSNAGWQLLGRHDQQARGFLKLSFVHWAADRPLDALEDLRQGRQKLSERADRRMELQFFFNEAWFLEDIGRTREARETAEKARDLAASFPDSSTQLRVQWLEGRLRRSEEHPDEAIDHFRAVQAGFLADKNPYDAALVSLDLAALYLEQGRHAEVRELATAMRAAFEALGVHREALAAWRLFTDACQRQAASVDFAKNLAKYLDQARHDPEYGFAAAGVWG